MVDTKSGGVGVVEAEVARVDQATNISKRYAAYAASAAVIPVPIADLAGVIALQVKLVNEISKLYEVPFKENRAKGAIISLLASVIPAQLGVAAASFMKLIPIVGQLLGAATAPAFAGAATYAVGRVFTKHFEAGGTLLTFDSGKMREYFKSELLTATKSRVSSAS
jgi:uncharacterized protein (DUF697 family)